MNIRKSPGREKWGRSDEPEPEREGSRDGVAARCRRKIDFATVRSGTGRKRTGSSMMLGTDEPERYSDVAEWIWQTPRAFLSGLYRATGAA